MSRPPRPPGSQAMTRPQRALYGLLLVVAAAAAVLSFDALRQLAAVCGFGPTLAPLLPVTVDAGAAAGSIVWLGRWSGPAADRYGRALALTLLGSSVAGNALAHGLAAYALAPHWLVVVGVSAVAPTVLGALVHLLVLAPDQDQQVADAGLSDRSAGVPTGPSAAAAAQPRMALAAVVRELDVWPADRDPTAADRDPDGADRQPTEPPMTNEQIIAAARAWRRELGRPPSRDEMLGRYRIGATRARTLRKILGWVDPPPAADRDPGAADRDPGAADRDPGGPVARPAAARPAVKV